MGSGRASMSRVWANNRGGRGGDPAVDIRAARAEDAERAEEKWARVADRIAADERSESQITEDLLNDLGLGR